MTTMLTQWQEARKERARYLEAFGRKDGAKIWKALESEAKTVSFPLPKYRATFTLRPGTFDRRTFELFHLGLPYGMPPGLKPEFILDLGANIGCASLFFAKKYSKAQILAVEPDEENLALCRSNTAQYPQVEVIRGGVWPTDGFLSIENPESGTDEFRVTEGDPNGGIPAYRIETLLHRAGRTRVDILKMDIEGTERILFAENTAWLARVGILIIELHDRFAPGCSRALFQALLDQPRPFWTKTHGENLYVFFEDAVATGTVA